MYGKREISKPQAEADGKFERRLWTEKVGGLEEDKEEDDEEGCDALFNLYIIIYG